MQLFSGDTHTSREDYHRKNHPTDTRRPGDVPWRSPKGPNVWDLQATFRGPIQKLMILWENCFSEVLVLALHVCFSFLQEEQIIKCSTRGLPRDVYRTQLWDVHENKWWNVLRTSVGRWSNVFLELNSQPH